MRLRLAGAIAGLGLLLAGCSTPGGPAPSTVAATTSVPSSSPLPSTPPTSTPPTSPTTTTRTPTTTTPTPTTTTPAFPEDPVDPRWRFFTTDRTRYTSAWFAGAHRVMIGFGCTTAPYYAHDPRCPGKQGFHHGIDVVMPCGTPLTSAVDGVVAPASGPGKPDGAYGAYAFRIRVATAGVDILIGHVHTVDVRPGQAVARGQRIALSADEGAPDGCHLHFEVRSAAGGLATARDPLPLLGLHAVG